MKVWHDENCDSIIDENELVYSTDYKLDSYTVTLSDGLEVSFDVAEEEGEFCFGIFIYDSDDSEDDLLDYSPGEFSALWFTVTLIDDYEGTVSYENNNNNEYKSVDMTIWVYVW